MSGDWGNLACPHCGAVHEPPDARAASNDDEWIFVHLACPRCGTVWERSVEIWRYYRVPERLPARDEDHE
jgi:uncharacterized C2H2 Zn-finger protein